MEIMEQWMMNKFNCYQQRLHLLKMLQYAFSI